MLPSASARRELQNLESLRLRLYLDPFGKPTIGYGHKCSRDEILYYSKHPFISGAKALEIFENDLARFVASVNTEVTWKINQNQFDALVMMVFNIGTVAFHRSTLLRDINELGPSSAPEEMKRWVHDDHGNVCEGLVKRRAREIELFKRPVTI